jgi:hypothetical protein
VKLQLLHLEPEEDFHSLRDKLGLVQAPYVALVWPEQGRPLARELDLILLRRYAQQRALAVGLLTFDPQTRQMAAEVGLPVLTSLDGLHPEDWIARPRRRRHPLLRRKPPDAYRELAWVRYIATQGARLHPPRRALAALGGLIALALLLYFGPFARVSILPRVQTRSFAVAIPMALQEGPMPQGAVPLREMEVSVQGEMEAPVSGRGMLPSLPARGQVTLRNLSDQSVWLPAGTRLRAPERGVSFETQGSVFLPAGIGRQLSAPVAAVEPGVRGNLPSGTRLVLDSPLGLMVEAFVEEPLRGGKDTPVGAVKAADLEALRQDLRQALEARARSRLEGSLAEGWVLLSESLTSTVVWERFSPEVGQGAVKVEGEMELRMRGLAYQERAMRETLREVIRESLPGGQALLEAGLEYEVVLPARPRPPFAAAVVGSYRYFRTVDERELRAALRGREVGAAAQVVEGLLNSGARARLHVWPSWWPWMPLYPGRISVQWQRVD